MPRQPRTSSGTGIYHVIMEKMKATHVGILHPYQFCVFEDEMQEIIKTYTYAYSGEEI